MSASFPLYLLKNLQAGPDRIQVLTDSTWWGSSFPFFLVIPGLVFKFLTRFSTGVYLFFMPFYRLF